MTRFFGIPNTTAIPPIYDLHFDKTDISIPGRPKRYLLRLINTSFGSAFIFSIDNHYLQVISTDFVPVKPFAKTSVLVGIGQRYNVVVEANPFADDENPLDINGNYWIRTWVAPNCGSPGKTTYYEQTGILRYNSTSTSDPTSVPWPNTASRPCLDETYSSPLVPKYPWTVGPANNSKDGESFLVTPNFQANLPDFPLARWSLENASDPTFKPLQINYSDPIFFHLDNFSGIWPERWVVVPENYTSNDWVSLPYFPYHAFHLPGGVTSN